MADTSAITKIEPTTADACESPAIVQFHAYWNQCRGDKWAPSWSDIDLLDIPAGMIRYVIVCDVLEDGDYYFRYWGSGHAAYHNMDFSQKNLSDMQFPWAKDALGFQYGHVVETKKPWVFLVSYENLRRPVPSYRAPLSNDGETVTGLLSFVPRQDVENELRAWHFDPEQ